MKSKKKIIRGNCCICGNKKIKGFINKKEYCSNCYERESYKIKLARSLIKSRNRNIRKKKDKVKNANN